ncbi:hypothetical protein RAA17_15295 [Komagataeibacter rhaeticus]|nr:hypothetical protein [Komagataeibacter rhaeticus]
MYEYLKHPQIQLNIYNLGDFHYLSGVEAITTNAYQTTAANGQTVAQNSPAYYVASALCRHGHGFHRFLTAGNNGLIRRF